MPDFVMGLDLAKRSDFTAISILRRSAMFDARGRMVRDKMGDVLPKFACQHLERHRGMHYPGIVERVMVLLDSPELGNRPVLVLDQTGVGSPVYDMFRDKNISNHTIIGITSTGGQTWSIVGPRQYNVSKSLVVSAMQVALHSGRLKISPKLPLADVVKKELISYKVKITLSANEQYMARDSDHDDCVIALMLPIYLATSVIGRGLLPSLADDEDEEHHANELAYKAEKERAEQWQEFVRTGQNDATRQAAARDLEERLWREKRRHQEHADSDDNALWQERQPLEGAPAWFRPDLAQADGGGLPPASEATYKLIDMFRNIKLPWLG